MRARLSWGVDGIPMADPFPIQDSSMIVPLAQADCLVVREPYAAASKAGERCAILKLGF
jgi:molybdopterin molybdotransferase